jgi:[ribosomal protein S18]-alanine N-acetyltransferase
MQARYLVRRAAASDLAGILVIERAGFGEWAWDRNLFAEYARKCGDLFLVAEDGEKVVGYCIGCITRGGASLESIAVAPSMKGKGVSDALLRSLLRRLRRRGVGRVGLMVKVTNLRAMGFYERYGFRRVRRVPHYYEDREDGVLFHLDL